MVTPSSAAFLALEPIVRRHARIVFRHLDEEGRDVAAAEAVAAAFESYLSLTKKGRNPAAFHLALQIFRKAPHLA